MKWTWNERSVERCTALLLSPRPSQLLHTTVYSSPNIKSAVVLPHQDFKITHRFLQFQLSKSTLYYSKLSNPIKMKATRAIIVFLISLANSAVVLDSRQTEDLGEICYGVSCIPVQSNPPAPNTEHSCQGYGICETISWCNGKGGQHISGYCRMYTLKIQMFSTTKLNNRPSRR